MTVRQRNVLSQSQEDYLKALYELGARAHGPVGTNQLSERLGVSAPSAAQMLNRLAELGLVRHDRLLEMYLTKALGYRWDEVHEEAERLEHVISEQMEQRIYDALGRPGLDPHGDPIPTPAGELSPAAGRPLHECKAGESVRVVRVSDRDPGKLRELSRLGLTLGTTVELVGESRYEGPLAVRVRGRRRQVALGVARAVYVS